MSDVTVIVKQKGAEAATKEIKSVGDAAEKSSGPIGKMGGALADMGKIAGGFVLGQGIMKAPGFLMDAAKAAAEDEAATLRLNKALENYSMTTLLAEGDTSDYAGMVRELTDDMNERIAAGQKLAFTDDQVRDSMQFLLAATGDYGEATKRSTAAMDLARGANIDLGLATKMLGKMNAENVEVFKKLGITLGENATEADALAEVQKKFGGQADAYAKSTAGQFEQLKIRMGELKESIGGALLPVMTALGSVLVNKVMPVVESLATKATELVAIGWDKISGPLKDLASLTWGALKDLAGVEWGAMKDAWAIVQPLMEKAAAYTWGALTDLASASWDAMRDAWKVIQPLLEKAAAYTWGALTDLASASWDAMSRALSIAVEQLNKIPAGKIKDEAQDTSNWADAWGAVKDKITPAVDFLRPFVETLLVAMKDNLDAVKESLGRLGESLGELAEALKPLQPIVEPLAKAIGVALVLALAGVIEMINIFNGLLTVALVVSIEVARLSILTITKVIEDATLVIKGIATATETAAGWIGHWLNVAGGYFEDFKNMLVGPVDTIMRKIQDLIDLIGRIPSPGGILSGIGGAVGGLGRAVSPLSAGGGGGGGSALQYIGGGQMGYRPYDPNSDLARWQFNDPSSAGYLQDKAVTINLVVDGAVLASVVTNELSRAM